MDKKKIIIAVVGLIILIVGIAAGVYLVQRQQELRKQAAPATKLSIVPAKKSVTKGEVFTLSIAIDTGQNSVRSAEIHINYSPALLQMDSFTAGTFLPIVLVPSTINNTAGKASITIGSQPTEPKTGTGTLVNIKFKAKNTGTATVSFDQQTQIVGLNETDNILASSSSSSIIITESAITGLATSPSPSPASIAALTTSPSPSPAASPVGGSTKTPSPTPTATAKPTSSPAIGSSQTTLSPSPTTTARPNASPAVSPSPSLAQLPQAGTTLPTFAAVILGVLLLAIGSVIAFRP